MTTFIEFRVWKKDKYITINKNHIVKIEQTGYTFSTIFLTKEKIEVDVSYEKLKTMVEQTQTKGE